MNINKNRIETGSDVILANVNFSLTSDYIWRGETQSGGNPAIQCNINYCVSNFEIGFFTSTIDQFNADYEIDLYLNLNYKPNNLISFKLGFISYNYIPEKNLEKDNELYILTKLDFPLGLSISFQYNDSDNSDYSNIGINYEVLDGLNLYSNFGTDSSDNIDYNIGFYFDKLYGIGFNLDHYKYEPDSVTKSNKSTTVLKINKTFTF